MELHCIEYAFACELDCRLTFDGIGGGNHANKKWNVFGSTRCTNFRGKTADERFGGEALGCAEHESEHVGAEFGGEDAVFFTGDAADFHERAARIL